MCRALILVIVLSGSAGAGGREFVQRVLGPKLGVETYVKLQDGTVADLFTSRYVGAVAFPETWQDAVGRALNGHCVTGCAPVVVLLKRDCQSQSERETERLHLLRCESLCRKLGIACLTEQYIDPPPEKKPVPAEVPPKRDPRKT